MKTSTAPGTDRQERIVSAAMKCFKRWGFARTRMDDIAKEAGIPRPHLYRHFAGKDEIILAVVLRQIRSDTERLHASLTLSGPSRDLIVKAMLIGLESRRYKTTQLLVSDEMMHVTSRLIAESDALLEAMDGYWIPILEYAKSRGELRTDVDLQDSVRWLTCNMMFHLALPEIVPGEDRARYFANYVADAILIR